LGEGHRKRGPRLSPEQLIGQLINGPTPSLTAKQLKPLLKFIQKVAHLDALENPTKGGFKLEVTQDDIVINGNSDRLDKIKAKNDEQFVVRVAKEFVAKPPQGVTLPVGLKPKDITDMKSVRTYFKVSSSIFTGEDRSGFELTPITLNALHLK